MNEPISTDIQLPDERTYLLWWHPRTQDWRVGWFRTNKGRYAPGHFKDDGAWYVVDGPTYWMPIPPPPEGKGQ